MHAYLKLFNVSRNDPDQKLMCIYKVTSLHLRTASIIYEYMTRAGHKVTGSHYHLSQIFLNLVPLGTPLFFSSLTYLSYFALGILNMDPSLRMP